MERHRQRHTETCKLRGTHTLRETPSSMKRQTLLRARNIHTLRKIKNKESGHTLTH